MDEIVIRKASSEDATLLAELGAQTFAETFAELNTPENMVAYLAESFSPEKQASELAEPGSTFLVAEYEHSPLGYARLLAGNPPECVNGNNPVELVRIYVSRLWLKKGVGSKLMEASLKTAKENAHDVIWLGVWEENPQAIAFYGKWGFRKVGLKVFKLGSDLQTDIIMMREIG